MKPFSLFILTLVVLGLTGCDAISVVPRAQPTQQPLPTAAALAPTASPTPAASPTATPPPATPTIAPPANPLDALKKVFGGWGGVKTFRAKFTRTSGTKTTEGTMEVVLPDRFHYVAASTDSYIIGKVFYIKTGTQWIKVPMPKDFDFSFANVKKFLDDLGVATDVKFVSFDVLDGAPMFVYQYTTTFKGPPALTTTTKVWVAVSDNLPRKSESTGSTGAKTVTTYYDYNANIVIEPPIK